MSNRKNKKKLVAITVGIVSLVLLAAIACAVFFLRERAKIERLPTVTIETVERLSEADRELFYVNVTLSAMGDALYPAASLSLSFDSYHLEFLGIEDGNIPVLSPETEFVLPTWSVNVDHSNKVGRINTMYLDISGGKYAFSKECMHTDGRDNVLLRLKFRLRGNAYAGEVYGIVAEDICLAAHDPTESMATADGSLRVIDGRAVIEKQ